MESKENRVTAKYGDYALLFGPEPVPARAAELRVVRIDLAAVGTRRGQQRVSTAITELVQTRVAHATLVAINDLGSSLLLFHLFHRSILTLSFSN